ncbi:Methyltransferase domain-containing protein [Candidatus Protochlamydia naegleriophila]|uniref:Methyltransferase domain-containing protein n=1 Tax=Candidatus Protochlamydia naegleriophila TaxID=389348 RepID=A0A0U5JCL6_9BACT|nr:methyltransferase [Candidatus Protochlamydia naegleriophila]CUI16871.1 Methyltransferase domain-containing protein [Candidatus Protochlamydia naegleriophila]
MSFCSLGIINPLQSMQVYCQNEPACSCCSKTDIKLQVCSKCQFAKYCNTDCQKKHWPVHKKVCQAWMPIGILVKKSLSKSNSIFPLIISQASSRLTKVTPLLTELFNQKVQGEKWALDLGCGYGASTMHLLQLGWKVIALEKNPKAIAEIQNSNQAYLKTNQLIVINRNIQDYDYSKKVSLVVITDVISYIDPKLIRGIWEKIYGVLEDDGHLIGSIFSKGGVAQEALESQGAWLLNSQEEVESILDSEQAYKKLVCRRRPKRDKSCVVEFHLQKQVSSPYKEK